MCASLNAAAPVPNKKSESLKRVSPSDWFSFVLPLGMQPLISYSDADGGEYRADNMRIYFEYWWGKEPPRDGNPLSYYSKMPEYRSETVLIRGKKARVVNCAIQDEEHGLKYYVIAYLQNIRMPEVGGISRGGFELTVAYRKRSDLKVARLVIQSISFHV